MIGHMILRRGAQHTTGNSAAILGLKVVGGKALESGLRGAVIDKVKKGSIADLEGQLRPGIYPKTKFWCFIKTQNFIFSLFKLKALLMHC